MTRAANSTGIRVLRRPGAGAWKVTQPAAVIGADVVCTAWSVDDRGEQGARRPVASREVLMAVPSQDTITDQALENAIERK